MGDVPVPVLALSAYGYDMDVEHNACMLGRAGWEYFSSQFTAKVWYVDTQFTANVYNSTPKTPDRHSSHLH
jgi:hypothetical protein